MRPVKSKAAKPTTVVTATRDARRIVEQVIPGVGATVTSRIGWDLKADRATVVTTVTFPASTADVTRLALATGLGGDGRGLVVADSSIVITRTV